MYNKLCFRLTMLLLTNPKRHIYQCCPLKVQINYDDQGTFISVCKKITGYMKTNQEYLYNYHVAGKKSLV